MARRAIRLQDLFKPERFAEKLQELLDFHNFVLKNYYKQPKRRLPARRSTRRSRRAERSRRWSPTCRARCTRRTAPARTCSSKARRARCSTSTTAPIRTSPRRTASPAPRRPARASARISFTTCWASPRPTPRASAAGRFPTELSDDVGEHLRQRGHEFGATTGRPRRSGWFDAAALKRSIQLNGVSGLCITKLDVLDGVEAVKICVGYEIEGRMSDILPVGAEELERCVAGLRGAAGLAGEHRRREELRRPAEGRARLPAAHRGALRRADRPHLHRARPRGDHRHAPPVRHLGSRLGNQGEQPVEIRPAW